MSGADAPSSAAPTAPSAIDLVFDHWRTVMNHPRAALDPKRRKAITAALKIGYTADELREAIDGCKASAWHMGANDRRTVFDGLDLILRDAAHIDKFRALLTRNDTGLSVAGQQTLSAAQRWLERMDAEEAAHAAG